MGLVRIYIPPIGACYECTLTELDRAELYRRFSFTLGAPVADDAGSVPTVATSSSLIAAIQVQEALKWIHGLDVPAAVGLYYNGHTNSLSRIAYTRREECPAHDPFGEPVALDARARETTLGSLMELVGAAAGADPVVVIPARDLVRSFVCPECGAGDWVDRPVNEVVPAGVACPSCGANRVPRIAARLGKESRGSSVLLCQLGFSPLEVLRCEAGGRRILVELAGDEPGVLSAWDIPSRAPRPPTGPSRARGNAFTPDQPPFQTSPHDEMIEEDS
jgi:adenylyltransferase/sulfurtransferase